MKIKLLESNKTYTLELKAPELNLMFDALTDLAIELEDENIKPVEKMIAKNKSFWTI